MGLLTSSFFFKLHWNNNVFGMSVVHYCHLFLILFSLYKLHQSSHHHAMHPPLALLYHITATPINITLLSLRNILLQTCHFFLNMLFLLTAQESLTNGIKHLLLLPSRCSATRFLGVLYCTIWRMKLVIGFWLLMAISWLSFFFSVFHFDLLFVDLFSLLIFFLILQDFFIFIYLV